MTVKAQSFDAVVVGGGPVGCVAALALAERGSRVLLCEANPKAAGRLAGEWLHPAGVEVLRRFGVSLDDAGYPNGLGFVVFPEDGSEEVLLPYGEGLVGASFRHETLVQRLRETVSAHDAIDYREYARVSEIAAGRVGIDQRSTSIHVAAERVVVASGRRGAPLDLPPAVLVSRMVGVVARGTPLPYEGYGHVFLGAPGPVVAYRVGEDAVRLCLDVPLAFAGGEDRLASLYDAYAPVLPEALRRGVHRAFREGDVEFAVNQVRRRRDFGEAGLALVGDPVGHHHPLTAIGLTLGFHDALSLAQSASFEAHRAERLAAGAVPEGLAIALYDVFAGRSEAMGEIRRAVVASWRGSARERDRTMRLLSCGEPRKAVFGASFARAVGFAGASVLRTSLHRRDVSRAARVGQELRSSVQAWLKHGTPPAYPAPRSITQKREESTTDVTRTLDLGARALVALQHADGSWEGEVVWCPMLAAEYVLAFHLMGRPIAEQRRERILLQFRRTQTTDGLWCLSSGSHASLFVTTLVYVAARILGVAPSNPLLVPARAFFATEGVESIPTWGKFWLAMLSLYRWEGVNPVTPELFALPAWLPVHPSRYYCHTRLIYMAMATLYAERFATNVTELTRALRDELYPRGFDSIDFSQARGALRAGDLWQPPGFVLRRGYDALRLFEQFRSRASRAPLLRELRAALRWELSTTNHTGISPVSGLLTILALWMENPQDEDALRAIDRFDCWIWEDDRDGARVAGARSSIWDTSFAVQALASGVRDEASRAAVSAGAEYLAAQQIRDTLAEHSVHHRSDPSGGYPFSSGWHGWPVSDCTAEALVARLEGAATPISDEDVALAARFILRMQAPDGGFGSYEPRRVPFSLEWLNPAEMFGDSMTESGYVECTASCLVALQAVARERSTLLRRASLSSIPDAIERGARAIRDQQRPSGAWDGAWGVRFIYGTWFAVRGLRAAGAGPSDPAIRRACAWLESMQLPDGGWGERHVPRSSEFVSEDRGRVVQTAWAMLTLLEAEHANFAALERGARFLASAQLGSGEWPREEPSGVFFRTALLDYTLYRSYFPLHALARFEARRRVRELLSRTDQQPQQEGLAS